MNDTAIGNATSNEAALKEAGIDENWQAFQNKVVDLYTIENGRIALKDTYWKYFR